MRNADSQTPDLHNQKLRLGPSRLNLIKLHRCFLSMLKCEKYTISYCQLSEETGNVAFSDCAKHTEDSERLSDYAKVTQLTGKRIRRYSPSNEYSGLISFRIHWFDLLAVQGNLKSLIQHHSSKASILLHSAVTSIHDYWKNHSFD